MIRNSRKRCKKMKTSCIFYVVLIKLGQNYTDCLLQEVETNMQDMQDMMRRLNQSGKRLSKGHRKIAEYIVEH